MFKEKLKGFAAGIIVSTLFAGTVAYAAGGSAMLEVFYKVNDIKINKVSKMPTDAGDKPFIYNGSTYVPLRYIAENLGQKVGWDGETGTVFIGETNGPNEEFLGERIQPMNTQVINSSWDNISLILEGNKVRDNQSNEYENYVTFLASMAVKQGESIYQDYPLNGKYTSFKATVGIMKDEQDSPNIVTFVIEGDGKEVYTHNFGPGDFPENVSVNVEGIKKLTLKVTLKEEKDFNAHSMIGVFNPTLTLK
ncbi:NPCBM/NEW2 domain-containing protein [Paenibacillus sp. PAMC21692]|uniref:NPCBM/NEW2 domain-containing protein n=1 Tax=Paenibacillus sp. PAMC21692 TaxID=2762320 RepID=UPI00164D3B0B|nr:NPCBM/NEW2 domain-containing protein [Paenibacillus sp. PAMC21692]QNK57100.1 NPCBM/NEW2 domain-containing protein [Paenibacillus sp. PAMC21692]